MTTSKSSKPTRHGVGFRVVGDDGAFRVVWLDQIDGEAVSARDSIKSATPKLARERLRRLEKLTRDQQPRVVWVESKNSYQLHVKIDGRTRRVGLSEKDYDLAVQKVPRKMIEMGWTDDVAAQATLGQAIDGYLAKRRDRPGHKSRVSVCANFLACFTHDKPVASFTREDQQAYQRTRPDVATATRNAEAKTFNAVINQALKDGLIDAKPPTWERVPEPEVERLVLTKQDWADILDVAAGMLRGSRRTGRLSDLELYLHMVRYTGGRRSFYRDLRWDRVDFATGTINFAVVGETYTTKRRPVVPISADLLPILQAAFEQRDGSQFVLWQRVDFDAMFKGLRIAMRKSNNDRMRHLAPVIHSHAFRRSFATWCAAQGFSPWVIGKITGNSAEQIEKTYAVFQPSHALGLVNEV